MPENRYQPKAKNTVYRPKAPDISGATLKAFSKILNQNSLTTKGKTQQFKRRAKKTQGVGK